MKKRVSEFISSYRDFTQKAYAPLQGLPRLGVCFCNVILAVYIATILILHRFAMALPNLGVTFLCGLMLSFFLYQCTKFLFLRYRNCYITCHRQREKLPVKWLFGVFTLVLSVYLLNLFAHYPGGISPDNITQWKQVQTGNFDNWHPAVHTMLIWIITRILTSYSFFIGIQIVCFSLLTAYMAATLVAWGIRKQWVILFLFIILSAKSTRSILLYAWKDTALTICMLCLAVFLINIVLSDGKWLKKWYCALLTAFVCALVTILRHNGFFFTLPLYFFIVLFYRKQTKNVILAVSVSILMFFSITRVLYSLAEVTMPESQTYVESVGIPMTILGGVMVRNPQLLDAQTKTFLNKIADDETWKTKFRSGNYNSIKWACSASDVVAETPPKQLLLMLLRTIKNAPQDSLLEVIALTRMVWNPLDWNYGVPVSVNKNAKDIVFTQAQVDAMRGLQQKSNIVYTGIEAVIDLITPTLFLSSIGVSLLLLLLSAIYSINRNRGVKSLLLLAPSIAYNLGTMLLLCGPDYRFFHFNVVVSLPFSLVLLAKAQTSNDVAQLLPEQGKDILSKEM